MPKKATTPPSVIKSEPLSPTVEGKRSEQMQTEKRASLPPGLDVEDGEITEDDTVVTSTVSIVAIDNIVPPVQRKTESGVVTSKQP